MNPKKINNNRKMNIYIKIKFLIFFYYFIIIIIINIIRILTK